MSEADGNEQLPMPDVVQLEALPLAEGGGAPAEVATDSSDVTATFDVTATYRISAWDDVGPIEPPI